MTVAYLCVSALLVLALPAVRHQRPAVSVPAVAVLLATAGWNLTRVARGPDDPAPSLTAATSILLVEIGAVSFYVLCRRLVHGRWRIPLWMWIAVVWFGTAVFLGMLPAMGITTGPAYDQSPIFIAHLVYSFAFFGGGLLTLSTRQHDESPHVRHFVAATEFAALLLIAFQIAEPGLTSLAAAAIALLAVWTTRHAADWNRSATRADRLLDSIGVFIFVVDRNGVLQDWNGPAASLLELKGLRAERGLDLGPALGADGPFVDGATVSLPIGPGTLRVAVSVHDVDPLRRLSDHVVMFRPVRSSVESSSFPRVSGSLAGHDPATQTLARKAALDLLERAVEEQDPIVRFTVAPPADRRPDDVMFLVARRLESRSLEVGWDRDIELARLDTWTFVAPLYAPERVWTGQATYADLNVDMTISVLQPRPRETSAGFTRRVLDSGPPSASSANER